MRPNSAMTESTAASTDSWLVTSTRTPSDLRPGPAIAAAVSSASPWLMSPATTSAPQRASAAAMPRPMPRPPPVTSATLSRRSIFSAP